MIFCGRLKETRIKLEKTQLDMAKDVGISKRSYYAYESGETPPSPKLLTALAEMGIDVSYLLIGKPVNPLAAPVLHCRSAKPPYWITWCIVPRRIRP